MTDRPEIQPQQQYTVEHSNQIVQEAQRLLIAPTNQAERQEGKANSLKKIVRQEKRSKEAAQSAPDDATRQEIAIHLDMISSEHKHEAVAKTIELHMQDAHDLALKGANIVRDGSPINVLLQGFIDANRDRIQNLPERDPQRVVVETTIEYLGDVADHVSSHDVQQLRVDLTRLPTYREILGNRQFIQINTALEQTVVDLLKSAYMRSGKKDEKGREIWKKELAQELVNFGLQKGYTNFLQDPELQELFDEYRQGYQAEEVKFQKQYERPNQFTLGDSEVHTLLHGNPFDLVEDILRQLEKGKNIETDQLARAILTRLSTIDYHLMSDEFVKSQWKDSVYHLQTGKTIDQFLDELRRKLYSRLFGHNLRMAVQAADFQAVQQHAAAWGSGGFFNGLLENQSHIAFNRLEQKLEQFRLQRNTEIEQIRLRHGGSQNANIVDKMRLVPAELERIKRATIDDLDRLRSIFGFKDREQVEAAVNTAYNALMGTQRVAYTVSRGKAPIEDMNESGMHSFIPDPLDYVTATFSAVDYQLERFFIQTDPQKKVLFGNLLDWVGHGDQDLGRYRLNDILQNYDILSSGWRTKTMIDALRDICIHEYGSQKDANGVEAWKKVYDTLALGVKLKRVGKDYRWENPHGEGKKILRKELEETWVHIAKYRPQEIAKILAENVHYKRTLKETGVWEYEYLKFRDAHGQETEFTTDKDGRKIKVKVVDPNRPNAFVEVFAGDDPNTNIIIYDENGVRIKDFTHLEQFTGKYFYTINDLLATNGNIDASSGRLKRNTEDGKRLRKGLAAIEYSQGFVGLDAESRRIVNDVFEKLNPNDPQWQQKRDQYFETMAKLAVFANGSMTITNPQDAPHRKKGMAGKIIQFPQKKTHSVRVIDELIDNNEYQFVYQNHVRFFDDARLFELQDQDRRFIDPIAVKFATGEGSGTRDMMARGWSDTAAANNALQKLQAMVTTTDQEVILKSAQEYITNIKDVEGVKEAMTGFFYVLGSWLDSAKAGTIPSLLSLDKMPFAVSKMQEVLGIGAPSLNPQEIHNIVHEVEKIAGHYAEFIPDEHILKEFKKVSGSKDWVRYLYNSRILIILFLIFLFQEGMKEAQKAEAA